MRRTVQKITPSRTSSFDQQFWPVIVALTVLCGIAIGAVLTLLRGPWMWGSLMILPAMSAVAVVFLFHLDNSKLRRSLQLAIILSLAGHLLILVSASVVYIFQNPYQQPEKKVALHQQRSMQISDQRTQFVWEETNVKETPEPKIETERQQQTTTDVQPQPVPVENTKPEFKPQLVRRETPERSVPRQDRQLSQLRRQTENVQPKSTQQTTGQQVTASAKPAPEATSSAKAESIERQSASNPDRETESKMEKAESVPLETVTERDIADSNPRRAPAGQVNLESAPQSSSSTARIKKPTPNLPSVQKKSTLPDRKSASSQPPVEPQPAPASTEVTRRPTSSDSMRPAPTSEPKTERSPQPQVARSAERRAINNLAPSISSPSSIVNQPRRSTNEATVAASPVAIEKPNRQPDSSSTSTELNSKTLSVSRGTTGMSGAGRSDNLESATGGITSPAVRASDAANRKRTESRPTESRMLTSSQNSTSRRSSGEAKTPSSAFKADSIAAAKISGSSTPTDRTLESSAANIDSATDQNRGERSVEKGTTSIDLGPTKVVFDQDSPRRSGGGQPEVSQLNPESTQQARNTSNQQPSLVADMGVESVAPRSLSSSTPSSELEPGYEATAIARQGGSAAVTIERDASTTAGEFSNQGQSDVALQLADAPQRAQRESDAGAEFSEEDEEDEVQLGNQRTKIAQAPVTRSDVGLGNSQAANNPSLAHSDEDVDVPSESVGSALERTASSAMPGSGVGRTATSILLQAATSLPVIEPSTSRRAERKNANADTGESDAAANDSRLSSTTPGRRQSDAKPEIANTAAKNLAANRAATGSQTNAEIEATSTTMDRPDSTNQEQGAALEVVALEGPAGLADRPDIELGVMTRPSSRDSEQIQPDIDNRFRSTRFGGTPAVNPDAVLAREAFRQRSPAAVASSVEPTTEAAIHLGLEFLARYQSPDGSWSLSGFDQSHPQHVSQLDSDTAATGLALLAFQGAGYNHREFKYARQMNHGLQWLIENQQTDGCLYVDSNKRSNDACRLYSHGIAALALTEAYGMTQDIQIKAAAQKALNYIAETQDARYGGWRYFDNPTLRSSDTSVTGWMMMALKSGRLAGLEINQTTINGIEKWLDAAADPADESQFRYNPNAVDSDGVSRLQGRSASPSMTSVGLLMRIYSGWDRNDPRLMDGATYLMQQQMPSDATSRQRDTYYWYYATQVLKYIDGPLWEKWDAQLRPLLIRSQVKSGDLAGSWHPYNPIPDRWGQFGGRLYVTTMNLLSLEVRHRMLPLYQKTNQEDK